MARLNVYVPDELVERAKEAGLNISALTQMALTAELDRSATATWLASLPHYRRKADHQSALDALDAARDEFGTFAQTDE